jgi:uncharacterized protein YbaR (Trm112 family)
VYESSLRYIQCVKCANSLELQTFEKTNEIIEGTLTCNACNAVYPIILSIPILILDLSSYFSIRTKLGGYLLIHTKSQTVRSIIKKSLKEIKKIQEDITDLEINWVKIYENSKNTKLESKISAIIQSLPKFNSVIEHGCSIGKTSEVLSKNCKLVFGVDKSFFALIEAKKKNIENADFFAADSLSNLFGSKKFDMVIALNILELIEPLEFLKIADHQTSKFVILSDPYDYERGKNSVKNKLDGKLLRLELDKINFKLIRGTNKQHFIPWKLNVNSRLALNYKVDLIVAQKSESFS